MKNSTFNKFNFKKAFIFCFCLLFGFGLTNLFVLNNSYRIENVSAQDVVEQTADKNIERILSFGDEVTTVVSTSSADVSIMAGGLNVEGDHCRYTSEGNVSTLNGGSIIVFNGDQSGLAITIYPADGNGDTNTANKMIIYVTPDEGYEFILQDGSEFFMVNEKSVALETEWTVDQLDPNYTGTINIKTATDVITYETNLFYKNNSGKFSYVEQTYTLEGASLSNLNTDDIEDEPENKVFKSWYLNLSCFEYSETTKKYSYTGYTNKELNFSVVYEIEEGVYKDEKTETFRISGEKIRITNGDMYVILTVEEEYVGQDGDEVYYNAYKVKEISGIMDFVQDEDEPMIVAAWENSYDIVVNNSNTYWSGFDATKNDTKLFGAGTSSNYGKTITLSGVSASSDYDFYDKKDTAFMKQSEVASNDFNGFYVYNYGHCVSGWTLTFDYDIETVSIPCPLKFEDMLKYFDIEFSSKELPSEITITPSWTIAKLVPTWSDGRYLCNSFDFGTSYALEGTPVGDGQTLFAYQDAEDSLVARSAIWNYTNLTKYSYNAGMGWYTIPLTSVGLNNVYKVKLNDAKANENGQYEIETSGYTYYDSVGGYNGLELEIIAYNDPNLAGDFTQYSELQSLYPLVEDYIEGYLSGVYKTTYERKTDGEGSDDYPIFKKIYYSSGNIEENTLTATNQELWIYVANEQKISNLPTFATKYFITISWESNSYAYTTDLYNKDYVNEVKKTIKTDNIWKSSYGTTLKAYYMKKIYLYYDNVIGDGYLYEKAQAYGDFVSLDFANIGRNEITCGNNKFFGRWLFDVTAASANGYSVTPNLNSENVGTLTVTETATKGVTTFTVSGRSKYADIYYVTEVIGDVFKQDSANPVLKAEWINKYNVVIDNSGVENIVYWQGINVTKTNDDLFGAGSSTNTETTPFKATLQTANLDDYSYGFMDSLGTDNKGLAFYKKSTFPEAQHISSTAGTYYVYNYGHYITHWEIYFTFPNNKVLEITIDAQGAFHIETGRKDDSSCSISILTGKTKNFMQLSAEIDEYLATLGYVAELPTITMIPMWDAAEITTNYTENPNPIKFGETYGITGGTVDAGQTLFAYLDGNNLIAKNGVWNYQNLSAYDGTGSDKQYYLELSTLGLDNVYKVVLNNATTNLDGVYELENDFVFSSTTGITYEDENVIKYHELHIFSEYGNQELVDTYITYLNLYRNTYLDLINGNGRNDHSIFSKVYYSAGLINDGKLSNVGNQELCIYLANNQAANMPRFKHDLSKLIHWQNENGNYAYLTSDYDEQLYNNELKHEDDESNRYVVTISENDSTKSVWGFADGGTVNNLSLKARYVYSVRLYYNVELTYDASNNAGYFGLYTPLNDINSKYVAPTQTSKEFEKWVFDSSKVAVNGYTVSGTTDSTSSTETGVVQVKIGSDTIKFAYDGKNKYNSSLYYITSIQGAGRMLQKAETPIVYSKWMHRYSVTIDNTSTYWANKDIEKSALYGAKSSGINGSFATDLIVANKATYAYPYQDSEISENIALSFYHATDWESNKDGWSQLSHGGYYYVYNYGHYISGWTLSFKLNGKTHYIQTGWTVSQYDQFIDILTLSSYTLQNLAAVVDEYAANTTQVAKITIIPVWEEAAINVNIDANYSVKAYDTTMAAETFADNDQYVLVEDKVKLVEAKSIMHYYYNDDENNVIARNGVWNYANIPASEFTYARDVGVAGSGVYTIVVKPCYVDDIYQVSLENAKILTTNTYKLSNCDFAFNNISGDYQYNNDSEIRLNFENTFNQKDKQYSFADHKDYAKANVEKYTLIDAYIIELKTLKNMYLNGINSASESCFDIFKKVYYSTGTVETTDVNNDTLVATSTPNFHIYLANAQKTGLLPVFEKDYYSLIFWQNAAENSKNNYFIYPTNAYDSALHSEEIAEFDKHLDDKDNFTYEWYYTDGYDKSDTTVSLVAHYYRKNYAIEVSTINSETQEIQRRGYVRLVVTDVLAEVDPTLENTGGDYLIISTGNGKMAIYRCESGHEHLIEDWNDSNCMRNGVSQIRLYAGCDVTMYVYDQGKDPTSMASGLFDDMIGYKFNQTIIQSPEDKALFGNINADNYSYSVNAATIEAKKYTNKEVIQVAVGFERIVYTMTFKIDNHLAGQFNLHANNAQTGQKTLHTLNNITVQENYKVDYYAYAGFKLYTDAFVLNNGIKANSLQTYDENEGKISQEYMLTENDYQDYTLDGEWLREHFYVDHIDYSVLNTNLGTLLVQTCPIEFTYGVKVYDETDMNYAGVGNIIETPTKYNISLTLNKTTGIATTPQISTYLTNAELGFYYYTSIKNIDKPVNYALLSSRMYFPKNPLETVDNFYSTYSFLLTSKPTNQATLSSSHLSRMVTNFEEGKIISVDHRNIFIMLEVRKLLKVDMYVASLDHDSNATVRSTTLSNADNNNVEIKINPNAETVAELSTYATSPILGYYKTSSVAINPDKTIVRAYTYYGLTNTLSSIYEQSCYSAVEYFIDGNENLGNTFTLEENAELLIQYIPGSLKAEFVYMLDGEVKSLSDVSTYIIENSNYKPTATTVYHAGDYVAYVVECVNADYDVVVTINETLVGATNAANRKIELLDENRYKVGYYDVACGKIEIVVDIRIQNNEKINVQYQLVDASKKFEYDDYGTFSVYENETQKADNVKTAEISVIKGRDVYVSLNLPIGYEYVGIKQDTYDKKTPQIDQSTNKILMIGDFDPETHSGSYVILINKISITATLDISGKSSNTTRVNEKSTYRINNSLLVTDLYVGKDLYFDANPDREEEFYNFYYLDKENNKQHLVDEQGSALSTLRITSELLEKVNNTIITFSVAVEQKFRLDLTVVGEEFIKLDSLKLEVFDTGEKYETGTYQVKGTVITLMVETLVTSKYNINFNNSDYDVIGRGEVLIELNQNYAYILTVTPKQYNISDSYHLYTTLKAVEDNQPDQTMDDINSIVTSGYVYNTSATLIIASKPEVGELYSMLISGNDYENDLLIEFNVNSYKAYKIVEGVKEQTSLTEHEIDIKINDDNVNFTYVIRNNITIKFEYKQYKLITS